MAKAIIRYADNTEWCYPTRIDNNQVKQVSKTYSTGVIEFESKEEAEKIASNLLHPSGNPLKNFEIIPV